MSTFEWLRKKKEEEERESILFERRAEETGDCVGCRREKV